MAGQTKHIVMLPYMAQGHLRPFLELAIQLHTRTTFQFTILTTPLNVDSLRQKLPASATGVSVVELQFNAASHDLPPQMEDTQKSRNLSERVSLFRASLTLEPGLRRFMEQLIEPPLCVVFDVVMGWVAPVARGFGSLPVCFTISGAYGTASLMSFWDHLPHSGLTDDHFFSLPGFPESHRFLTSQIPGAYRSSDGSDEISILMRTNFRMVEEYTHCWLCNSAEELEPTGFDILRSYVKSPVWPVGPQITSIQDTISPGDQHLCIQWLNTQKPDTVLYISFGSQYTISSTDMLELAAGLELAGKPFLWIIRTPSESENDCLPVGFIERLKQSTQGILIKDWGPQVQILKHPSTGGFLSHCGWNSVLESLTQGVPIIGMPLGAEQMYNLRLLKEDIRVAADFGGKFSREEVSRVIQSILDRTQGSCGLEIKNRAVEVRNRIKNVLRDDEQCKGSSTKAMEGFVDAMLSSLHK